MMTFVYASDALIADTANCAPRQPNPDAPQNAGVHGQFSQETGQLIVFADDNPNSVTLSRNGKGQILVNGGSAPIEGDKPTIDNVKLIQVLGQGGADRIVLDERNGPLPPAHLFGGDGNDQVTGGSGNDLLFGQGDDDTLNGAAGDDLLFGGSGNDVLTGGVGNDQMFGESGDDRILWKGDGVDLADGGSGNDVLDVSGTNGGDVFNVTANGTAVNVAMGDGQLANINATNIEEIKISGGRGDDVFNVVGNVAALTHLTIDGGAGNDTIRGGNGNDLLIGGDGNDIIDGNQGSDTVLMGSGNDTFSWDPGDGSDIVDGGSGSDTVRFNGSNAGETMALSANGNHATFTRNIANITLDMDNVEQLVVRTLGAADTVTVGDMRGTDLRNVTVDLSGFDGKGDATADEVNVTGSSGNDSLTVRSVGEVLEAKGLGVTVRVENGDLTLDHLAIRGLGGDDNINANGAAAGQMGLILDGGEGNDTLDSGAGNDLLLGGAGNDRLLWQGGDGNDVVDGGGDIDVLEVEGTTGGDNFSIVAGGNNSVVVFKEGGQAGSVSATNVEEIKIIGKAGDDIFNTTGNVAFTHITIDGGAGNDVINGGNGNDLLIGGDGNDIIDGNQGSDTVLMGSGNDTFTWDPGDGSDVVDGGSGTDTLRFNGSNAGEDMTISANGNHVTFFRNIANITMDLDNVEQAVVRMLGAADRITIGDMRGSDLRNVTVDLSGFDGKGDGAADEVNITGTTGNDTLTAASVNGAMEANGLGVRVRVENGEIGTDFVALRGLDGNDTITARNAAAGMIGVILDGGNGDDILQGGAGNDRLLGGADNDRMVWQLGDGLDTVDGGIGADRLDINAGGGDDQFFVFTDASGTHVLEGPAGTSGVVVTGVEDIVINGKAGNDTINASSMNDPAAHLTIDGGAGNDQIFGSNGNDTLLGGDGNDIIDGQRGNDVALMGAGNDMFVWDPGDGSDFVDGGSGTDILQFNGSNAGETMTLSANGDHALFFRNIANISMDLDNVEQVNVKTLGAADTITINDMTGTEVKTVNIDLAGFDGKEDAAADLVSVHATNGNDFILVNTIGEMTSVTGLHTRVNVSHGETIDRIEINGFDGNDIIDASGHLGGIGLTLNGGAGNDILIGGEGNDILVGGDGNDTLIGGNGIDVLNGGAGDDTFVGIGDIIIDGFTLGDRIDLSGLGGELDFDAVMSHARMEGSDLVLDFGPDHTITLRNVQMESLGSETFLLGAA